MAQAEQDAWVNRVLGISIAPARGTATGTRSLMTVWRQAKDDVDGGLEALGYELRSLDDPDADEIADKGLFGITDGGATVGLMTALIDYDGAAAEGREGASAQLRKALAQYRSVLDKHPLADMLDNNPFGIKVGVQSTIGHALNEIDAALN